MWVTEPWTTPWLLQCSKPRDSISLTYSGETDSESVNDLLIVTSEQVTTSGMTRN